MTRDTFANRLRHLDLYAVLEVKPSATADEISRAYRPGALSCHPDKHPNDKQAGQRFLLLTQARDVLLNADARMAYDNLRMQSRESQEPDNFQGNRPRGRGTRRTSASDPLNEQKLAERACRSRSAAELVALWQKGTIVVRAAILRNAFCPIALFSESCIESHWMLGLEAASRAQCPPAVLAKLAESFERCVAIAVASHPATPSEALGTIAARHRDLPILCALAGHPNASPTVLWDIGRTVRGPRSIALGAAVIAHPACPTDLADRIRTRLGNLVA